MEQVQQVGLRVSAQHLFRYASEWDPREPGHTKVTAGNQTLQYMQSSQTSLTKLH